MRSLRGPRITALLTFARQPTTMRVAKMGLFALIILFLGRVLIQVWSSVISFTWHINWPLLACGFAFFVAQELSFGRIWQVILQRLGYRLPWNVCLRIYLAAEFVRYIPGNVWHVMTRIVWAEREGVPKSYGLASMTIELATRIAAAALAFAITLFWWPDVAVLGHGFGQYASVALAIVGIPLLVVGLHPHILRYGLNRGLTLLKRDPINLSLTYTDILRITGAWLASWLFAGLGFWLTVWAVTPIHANVQTAIICIGIYALGWDIGFLSFITPSGLGFREGAVALLLSLSGVIPNGAIAGVLAVFAARLVPTIAEILCVGWAYWVTRRPRATSVALAPLDDDRLRQGNIRIRESHVRR